MGRSCYRVVTCFGQEQMSNVHFHWTSQNTLRRSFKSDESIWAQLSFLSLVKFVKKEKKSNGLKWNVFNTAASAIHALSRRGGATEIRKLFCLSYHTLEAGGKSDWPWSARFPEISLRNWLALRIKNEDKTNSIGILPLLTKLSK